MPAMSFTVEEILPSLLDKTKTQTIRPLGKLKLKKGDIVTMYWRQRNPNQAYCRKCYMAVPMGRYNGKCLNCGHPEFFNKNLGKAMITDIFEIEMLKRIEGQIGSTSVVRFTLKGGFAYYMGEKLEELAKKDGFRDSNQMFRWFDEKYDLKDSKKFEVRQWSWLDAS